MKKAYEYLVRKKRRIFLIHSFLLFTFWMQAEGSKQLCPASTDRVNLNLCSSSYNRFGRYDGVSDQRLNIHISNTANEQVFLGFSQPYNSSSYPCSGTTTTAYFRIKDPSGNVVFPLAGSANGQAITAAIAGWSNVVAGPNQIVGSGGYNAVVFNPAGLQAGDYYVEFSTTQGAYSGNEIGIEWWDITVATKGTSPQALNGRVFAKNWAFGVPPINCTGGIFGCTTANQYGAYDRSFNGAFYVYASSDSIVTRVNFANSGVKPYAFNVFFNDKGPGSSGNVITDRKSIANSLAGTAQYPLFLNNPDTVAYPSGSIGTYGSEPFVVSCDGKSGQFFVTVTKAGQLDVLVDLTTTSGPFKYDSGTRDVLLAVKVVPNPGELPPYRRGVSWDGKDGLGNIVDLTQPFNFMVNYTQGVFHLPVFDAEFMTTGFTFNTVRPMPPPLSNPIRIYYDDSNISYSNLNGATKTELNGCLAPCHAWNNGCYGDGNTINTWFYGSEERKSKNSSVICLVDAINDTALVTTPSKILSILSNDKGGSIDSASMSIIGLRQPLHGGISLNSANHTITYTPTVGFAGRDSFQYVLCDSNRYVCDTAWVMLTMPFCGTGGTTSTLNGTQCGSINSGIINLSGNTAPVIKWQTSTTSGLSWIDIANTSASLAFTNVVNGQQYRAVVNNGSPCTDINSSITTITVNSLPTVASIVKTDPTIATCPSPNNGSITLTATGANLRYSKNAGTTWQTTTVFANLPSGTTTIRLQDSITGCYRDTAIVLIAPNCSCATIAGMPADITSCSSTQTLVVNGLSGVTTEDVTFVYFTTLQTDATIIYGGTSTVLGTVSNASLTSGKTTATYSASFPVNNTVAPITYHTYAIFSPTSLNPTCRSFGHVSVIINPTPSVPTASVTAQPSCVIATGTITVTAPTGTGISYSIDGTNYTNTTGIFSGISAGTYSITAKNSQGCVSAATIITVNAQPPTPSAPTASVILQPTCSVSTGSITVTAPTGAGITYSINGVNYTNSTGVFSNVIAGTYSVTSKNSQGCISPATSIRVNAQPPTPATPTTVTAQPTCSVATGTITVTAPIGVEILYSIDDVNYTNTTGVFSGVSTGTYSVTVKNSVGCISSPTTVTVNVQPSTPSVPTASVTAQPTCSVATGTITVTAPTGVGITYSIDGVNYVNTTGVFAGVAAGTYTVTAKNSVGCISPATSVTVNAQPPTPSVATASVTVQPTCSVATGTITVTAPIGGGMTYSIDGVNYVNTTGVFSNIITGTYSITAKNSFGCISVGTTVTVNTQPSTPATPTASVTAQPNCSVAIGTITVIAPTGVGMTYSIDGVNYVNTTGIFTGISAGTYSITAKNSVGCISLATSVTVNVQPLTPSVPTASVTVQPTCSVATGTITVTAPTGGGMTYSINGVNYTNTTGIFTSVPPQIYNITAKNSVGCISTAATVTVNIQPPTPSTPTASVTAQPTCIIATGTITVSAPTGAGMTYSIDGVNYANTTGVFTGISAGTYSITAKNSVGCISLATSVTVNAQPPTPSVPTASVTAQPTCSVATGTIIVTAPTGAGMTYSIDGVNYTNTTGVFTNIVPATYQVRAKNSIGCISGAASLIVNAQPVSPVITSITHTDPTAAACPFGNDGRITVNATGTNLEYSKDSGLTWQTNSVFTGLIKGNYKVLVRNAASGCVVPNAPTNIIIDPYNCKPIAYDDSVVVQSNSFADVLILLNDTDDIGLVVSTLSIVEQGAKGIATVNTTTGQIHYVPSVNTSGFDTISYRICDTGTPVLCDTAHLFITILNQTPILVRDSITISEDTTNVMISILNNDHDSDGSLVNSTLTIKNLPLHGLVSVNTTTGQAIYTPNPNFNGIDSFRYRICDNGTPIACDSTWVLVNIVSVNDTPSVLFTPITLPEDSTITICTNVIDPDLGDSHSVTKYTQPQHGTASYTFDNTTKRLCLTYTPTANYNGQDTVGLIVCDNGTPNLCDTVKVPITITPVNDKPSVTDSILVILPRDSTRTYCTAITDPDSNDVFTAMTTCTPHHGSVTPVILRNETNTGYQLCVTYTPTAGFVGLDSVCIKVCDAGGLCDTVKFKFTVENICINFNLKVLLEGPFNTSTGLMSTTLNQRGLLPGQTPIGQFGAPTLGGQPYNTAPWNYLGQETVSTYASTVVDWVLVSFRTSPVFGTTVFRTAALLHNNGAIQFVNPCITLPSGSYYIVIEHRNHMGVMSPSPVPVVNYVMTFDFTTGDSYVLTDPPTSGQKVKANKWLMYAGDGKKTTSITNFDINFSDSQIWKLESGLFDHYRYSDFNMDADVNFLDSQLWKMNNGRYSGVLH